MEDAEQLQGDAERIFLKYTDEDGVLRQYAFNGKRLVKAEGSRGVSFDVALTEQDRLVVLIEDDVAGKGTHIVYNTFDDFSQDERVCPDVIQAVAAAMGEDYGEGRDS